MIRIKTFVSIYVWTAFIWFTIWLFITIGNTIDWYEFSKGRDCAQMSSPYTFFQEDPSKGYVSDIGKLIALYGTEIYVCTAPDLHYTLVVK